MKLSIFTLFLFFIILNSSFSQSIDNQYVGQSGFVSTGESFSLEWTVGETFNSFNPSYEVDVKEGILQPQIEIKELQASLFSSLENNENGFSATVFPNPFSNQFTFSLEVPASQNLQLSLLDYTGKTLMEKMLENGSQQMDWNMQAFPPGLYFLRTMNRNGSKNQIFKLIKL